MVRLRAVRLGDAWLDRHDTHIDVQFSLGLPAELFPVSDGGLQLLVDLLAGDMFPSEVDGCRWSDVTVRRIELSGELRDAAVATFRRPGAHDIAAIRSRFGLTAGRPLLAFSLKPRVGPTFAEIRKLTLDVLREGFNIVELDTRNLALSTEPVERWIELGLEAAQVGKHVTAFSPNFSVPAPRLIDVATAWVDSLDGHGPAVLKVDGGLDGLTNLQSVRTHLGSGRSPVVTSYPLLRNQLSSAVGPGGWTDLLALSGADIVYPGGRPTFPRERRPVWGAHDKEWSRAARIYDDFISQGWPMPTIAGGVHPGHLHAFYELLGPNVAYFLGGAVALHPGGVREGARLCVAVLDEAITLAAAADEAGKNWSHDLNTRLLQRIERAGYPTALVYEPPQNIFGRDRNDAPRTFYRRAR